MSSKPRLHGLLRSYIGRHLAIACALSVAGGVAYKYLVAEPRKQKYADFYKNYDAEADCERMTKLGLLQSKQG